MRTRGTTRLCALAGTMVLALGASGCGEEESGSGGESTPAASEGSKPEQIGKGLTVGFVTATNCSNETVCDVGRGFKAQAEALGAKATVLENGADPINDAIKNMDQLTAQKVDAMAFWPLDPGAMKAPTRRANQAKIPVFAHDLYDLQDSGVVASITQGRELKAKQAAEQICKQAPDGGEILYGNFALPAPTLNFLRDKFKDYLEQCGGGRITIAGTFQNKTDDVAGARPTAEAALQKNRDVVAIDNYNDPTAIGASLAANDLGSRDKLFISGYNLAKNGADAVKAGRIDASWDYRPVVVGQILARQMVEYAAEKQTKPPKVTMVWPKCYTEANIADLTDAKQQLSDIAAGKDLAAADPGLTQEGSDIPTPADDLPGCPG